MRGNMPIRKTVTGLVFGRLTILDEGGDCPRYVNCMCSCGSKKLIRLNHITHGKISSCGCIRAELSAERAAHMRESLDFHGLSGSKAYGVWCAMKQRCLNKNNRAFKDYGGRGITICKEWLNSFESFFSDMGEPTNNLTLDRIDNSKGYSKNNCEWRTRKQQQRNRRTNRLLKYKGETKTVVEWAEAIGMKQKTFANRICSGWTIEQAIEVPLLKR
jgi:hypothetical protein